MSNTKRVLMYVVPVTLFSFALNAPKFMEVSDSISLFCYKIFPGCCCRSPADTTTIDNGLQHGVRV